MARFWNFFFPPRVTSLHMPSITQRSFKSNLCSETFFKRETFTHENEFWSKRKFRNRTEKNLWLGSRKKIIWIKGELTLTFHADFYSQRSLIHASESICCSSTTICPSHFTLENVNLPQARRRVEIEIPIF